MKGRAWLLLGVLSTYASSASADIAACIAAHEKGQLQERNGELLAAHASFAVCSESACPAAIRSECRSLDDRVLIDTPSVNVTAQVVGQGEVPIAKLQVDGTEVPDVSAATFLDPGVHVVRVELADGRAKELPLRLKRAEKGRAVVAEFDAGPDTPSPPEPQVVVDTMPTTEFVGNILLGVSGFFAVNFGVAAAVGKFRQGDLESGCAPNCQQSEVDKMRAAYLHADVSLLATAVAAATGTILLLTTDAPTAGASVAIVTSPSGLSLGVSGTF